MNIWLISDTHFGHENIQLPEYGGRPEGFENKIISNIKKKLKPKDLFIHLGDVCFGQEVLWHGELQAATVGCYRWLIRGNHDTKSTSWYLDHGWHSVAESLYLKAFGKNILFSHIPKPDDGYDLNIHGHFHNTTHRSQEPELLAIKNDKQILIAVEYSDYAPISLRDLIKRGKK